MSPPILVIPQPRELRPFRQPIWATTLALFYLACASAPQTGPGPVATQAPSASGVASTTAAQATPPAPSPGPLSEDLFNRWAQHTGFGVPLPFKDKDEQHFFQTCLPFHKLTFRLALLEVLSAPGGSGPPDPQRVATLAHSEPTGLTAEQIDWCKEYMIRGVQEHMASMRAVNVKHQLLSLGRAMQSAFLRKGKLCPSTSAPLPAALSKLRKGSYSPTKSDLSTPAWRCLDQPISGMSLLFMGGIRFQYEVRTNTADGSFTVVGRGSLLRDGKVDEYTLAGKVLAGKGQAGDVKLGEVKGRFVGTKEPVKQTPSVPPRPVGLPRWAVGKTVGVTFETIQIPGMRQCTLATEIAGRYCGRLDEGKPNPKAGKPTADPKLLLPIAVVADSPVGLPRYALVAGFWTSPAIRAHAFEDKEGAYPGTVKATCQLRIEGTAKGVKIGSDSSTREGFHPFTGTVSSCKAIVKPLPGGLPPPPPPPPPP